MRNALRHVRALRSVERFPVDGDAHTMQAREILQHAPAFVFSALERADRAHLLVRRGSIKEHHRLVALVNGGDNAANIFAQGHCGFPIMSCVQPSCA
jgi:hypothetical protein